MVNMALDSANLKGHELQPEKSVAIHIRGNNKQCETTNEKLNMGNITIPEVEQATVRSWVFLWTQSSNSETRSSECFYELSHLLIVKRCGHESVFHIRVKYQHHSDCTKKFSETDIFNMLELLIDNIFVMFGGRVFQKTVGIPMATNCAPLLADLFLYSYEADFIQGLLKKNEKKLARSFNFTFRYIDDVLSLNNCRFGDFVDRNYTIELEIKDTTDTDRSASYLDLHLEVDSESRLKTKFSTKEMFQFSYCELSIYMQQHSSSTCIWSIYLSDDTIFHSLWFLSGFPW